MTPFSCPVIEIGIWLQPLLRGHLTYKTTFLCPKSQFSIEVDLIHIWNKSGISIFLIFNINKMLLTTWMTFRWTFLLSYFLFYSFSCLKLFLTILWFSNIHTFKPIQNYNGYEKFTNKVCRLTKLNEHIDSSIIYFDEVLCKFLKFR
jgi:hypothetical protein